MTVAFVEAKNAEIIVVRDKFVKDGDVEILMTDIQIRVPTKAINRARLAALSEMRYFDLTMIGEDRRIPLITDERPAVETVTITGRNGASVTLDRTTAEKVEAFLARKQAEIPAEPADTPPQAPIVAWDILVDSFDAERKADLVEAIAAEFRGAAEVAAEYEATLATDIEEVAGAGASLLCGRVELGRGQEICEALRKAGAAVTCRPVREEDAPVAPPGPEFFGVLLRALPADDKLLKAAERALKKVLGKASVKEVREELSSLPVTIADRRPAVEARSMVTALRAVGCRVDLVPWAHEEAHAVGGSDLVNEVEREPIDDGPFGGGPEQPPLFDGAPPPPLIAELDARERAWEGDPADHRAPAEVA